MGSGLTTAQLNRLDHAAELVAQAFGHPPYLVGTANESNDFHDVDVRTMLDDEEFDALFGDRPRLWSLFCLSVSELLRSATGLPVDYQVQRLTEANEKHGGKMRNPLGLGAGGRRYFAGQGDATAFVKAEE